MTGAGGKKPGFPRQNRDSFHPSQGKDTAGKKAENSLLSSRLCSVPLDAGRLLDGHRFHFKASAFGQRRDLNAGAGGQCFGKVSGVNLIDSGKIVHVGQE